MLRRVGNGLDSTLVMRQVIPFALSYASSAIVATTLRYTDQRFLLFAVTFLTLVIVMVLDKLSRHFNLYVSTFMTNNVQFLLGTMLPIYIFQFLQTSLDDTPSPAWYEALAYIIILVLVLLLSLSMFASETLLSASGGLEATLTRRSKSKEEVDENASV